MKLKDIKIDYWMAGILLAYIPFHLFEEAMGNFPMWMQVHHWMSHRLSYGHWMAGNIFFYYPLLLAGFMTYRCFGEKLLFAGVAVLFWGILNFLEHSVYSVIDLRVSPGFYSSIILLAIGILGVYKLYQIKRLSFGLIAASLITALVYAGLPVIFQILCSPVFRRIFV